MQLENNLKLPVESSVRRFNHKIMDYSNEDFRKFWNSKSRKILSDLENDIISRFVDSRNSLLLDLGCGFGRNVQAYYNRTASIVLVDYAKNHLKYAMDLYKNFKNIYYVAADAYRLPFKSSVFSSGVCVRLFHHIEHPYLFIREFERVFNTGADIVFTYINRRNFFRILRYGRESFRIEHSPVSKIIFGTHPIFFRNLIRETGMLRIADTAGSGFLHQLTQASYMLNSAVDRLGSINGIIKLITRLIDFTQGKLNLSLVQFLQLRNGKVESTHKDLKVESIFDILQCPYCGNGDLAMDVEALNCIECKRKYPVTDGIFDFR